MNFEKELKRIKSFFDEVLVEDYSDNSYFFVCQNNVSNKGCIGKEVFLNIEISKFTKDYRTTNLREREESEILSDVNSIVDSIVLLKDNLFVDKKEVTQMSLFGGEADEEEIKLKDDQSNYEEYNKSKLKKIPFVKIFNFDRRGHYDGGIEFLHQIPTNEELIYIVKNVLKFSAHSPGRYDNFWFDNEHNYISSDEALSDTELEQRIQHCLRVWLVPYTMYEHYSYDNSYQHFHYEERKCHRYYFDKNSIYSNGEVIYSGYNIFSTDLLEFARKIFKVPTCKELNDEEIIEDTKVMFKKRVESNLTRQIHPSSFDNILSKTKNFKEFKKELISELREFNFNGGCSGYDIDGYSSSMEFHPTKSKVTIKQKIEVRKRLGYHENLKINNWGDDYIIRELSCDELYESIYMQITFKSTTKATQTSLFDFLVA